MHCTRIRDFTRYNQNLLVASAYGLSGRNVRTLSTIGKRRPPI